MHQKSQFHSSLHLEFFLCSLPSRAPMFFCILKSPFIACSESLHCLFYGRMKGPYCAALRCSLCSLSLALNLVKWRKLLCSHPNVWVIMLHAQKIHTKDSNVNDFPFYYNIWFYFRWIFFFDWTIHVLCYVLVLKHIILSSCFAHFHRRTELYSTFLKVCMYCGTQ